MAELTANIRSEPSRVRDQALCYALQRARTFDAPTLPTPGYAASPYVRLDRWDGVAFAERGVDAESWGRGLRPADAAGRARAPPALPPLRAARPDAAPDTEVPWPRDRFCEVLPAWAFLELPLAAARPEVGLPRVAAPLELPFAANIHTSLLQATHPPVTRPRKR